MIKTLTTLFNRAGKFEMPADGWFHLVPRGEFAHADSGLVQVVDDASLASMVNRFAPSALVDFDHFSYDSDKSSEAAAWVDEVQVRADGLWGRMRLTDVGEPALKNGRYRFISPVWLRPDVEELGGNRVRPLRLDTAGLTNNPNMKGMVALTNRNTLPGIPANAPVSAPTTDNNTHMKLLATKLGLSAEAAENVVLDALDKLMNRATTAETQLAALTTERDALRNRNTALLEEQIDGELAEHKVTDAAKIAAVKPYLATLKNRTERTAFLANIAPAQTTTTTSAPLTNRATAKTPATSSDDAKAAADDKQAAAIRNRASALRVANPKLSLPQAYQSAAAELETTK